MEDINSIGKIPYKKATPITKSLPYQKLYLLLCIIPDIGLVLFYSAIELIKWIINIVSPSKVKDISKKLALVTGGGNGLGREISLRLAKLGCNVAIIDVDEIGASNTIIDLKKFNIKANSYICDVSKPTEVQKVIEKIEIEMGAISILVNNAGIVPIDPFRDGKSEVIQKIFEVNVFAHFWTVRALLDRMIQRKDGHIIAISSMTALHPMPGAIIYSSSKFAVTGFMRALREELRQDGQAENIKLTCVHPYFMATRKEFTDNVNLKRFPWAAPEEVADAVIDGILKNSSEVVFPQYYWLCLIGSVSMPIPLVNLVRDHVLREKQIKMFSKKK